MYIIIKYNKYHKWTISRHKSFISWTNFKQPCATNLRTLSCHLLLILEKIQVAISHHLVKPVAAMICQFCTSSSVSRAYIIKLSYFVLAIYIQKCQVYCNANYKTTLHKFFRCCNKLYYNNSSWYMWNYNKTPVILLLLLLLCNNVVYLI